MAPSWKKSKGRALLLEDIRTGRVHAAMDWDEVFHTRPEFVVGVSFAEAHRLFQGRLKSARKLVFQKNSRAATELALLRQDRVAHPAPATNHRGEPRWEGSQVQKLLKKDIADKKHESLTNTQFYLSRPEYQTLPKPILVGHIEQEIKLLKFKKQYRNRYGY